MFWIWIILHTLLYLVGVCLGYDEDYSGAQVLHVSKDKNVELLNRLIAQEELDVWSGNRTHLDILVPSDKVKLLKETFQKNEINFDVMIENLQASIDEENPIINKIDTRNLARQGYRMNWDNYQRLDVIYEYLDFLARTYPHLVTVQTFGRTFEWRPLRFIRIWSGRPNAKTVFIDGGIHAREWVATASVTYIIHELVENRQSLPRELLELDFVIVPVINPDGYEFSRTVNRMWRKNRSAGVHSTCVGADLNRNFDFAFGGEGTSDSACSPIYRGRGPASELETRSLQWLLSLIGNNLKAYITFHSYGQYILIPYGYSRDTFAIGYEEMVAVGERAASAMKHVAGEDYQVGNTANVLYPAAGGSDDWTKARLDVPYAYCIELRDKGEFGFLLPARFIIPAAREAMEAVKVISEAAAMA